MYRTRTGMYEYLCTVFVRIPKFSVPKTPYTFYVHCRCSEMYWRMKYSFRCRSTVAISQLKYENCRRRMRRRDRRGLQASCPLLCHPQKHKAVCIKPMEDGPEIASETRACRLSSPFCNASFSFPFHSYVPFGARKKTRMALELHSFEIQTEVIDLWPWPLAFRPPKHRDGWYDTRQALCQVWWPQLQLLLIDTQRGITLPL